MNFFNLFKKKHECYNGKILDVYNDATLKIKCGQCSKVFIRKARHYCSTDESGAEEIRAKMEVINNIPPNQWTWYRIDGLTDILTDRDQQHKVENGLWKIKVYE